MNLSLNLSIAQNYKSNTQRSRVITETWVDENMYCPICGASHLHHYEANRPVADFFCSECQSDFELKSRERKNSNFNNIIPDGAYDTMIKRITSIDNPNLLVMNYYDSSVRNLIFIPKFFFVPEIIIKRAPLKKDARRAGWTGCNIDLGQIPDDAKIHIIENGTVISQPTVTECYDRILSLRTNNISTRRWLIDTMSCIDSIPTDEFTLKDLYAFENFLSSKYPNNNFIKDKLRQQLQILRDNGFIEFTSRGHYRKIKS